MRTIVVRVALSCVLLGSSARADGEDQSFLQRGIQLRREHRDAEALEQFQKAQALRPSPRTRAQIALAEQALAHWVQAEEDLLAALSAQHDRWIASHNETLSEALQVIRMHLGTLDIRANVDGAELWLNGGKVGALPMRPVRAAAGTVHVEIRSKGYEPASRTIELEAGATSMQSFELVAPPAQNATPDVQPPAKPRFSGDATRRTLAWSALGAAGAFAAGAVVTQLIRETYVAHYNNDAQCLGGQLSRDKQCGVYRTSANTAQAVANLGYIAAGALGIASVVLFLSSPDRPKSTGIRLSLGASASSIELGCRG